MPTAHHELRQIMEERFGSIMDNGPVAFLEKAGYILTKDFLWHPKPGITEYKEMTQTEWEAMVFLRDEWDYGMLALSEGPKDSS